MKNENKDYSKYEVLSLEEAIKEHRAWFDSKGEITDNEKLDALLRNPELIRYLFSENKLTKNASQEENLFVKASAEKFLKKSFPPSWYWEMPNFYYPGLYVDNKRDYTNNDLFNLNPESGKISKTITRNESVLIDCGWERKKYDVPEYFNKDFPNLKILFDKNSNSILIVKINPNSQEELSRISVPFALICGIFLKCRELDFDKPWQLRAHDYQNRYPDLFEHDYEIVRDPETHEIIDYGNWKSDKE